MAKKSQPKRSDVKKNKKVVPANADKGLREQVDVRSTGFDGITEVPPSTDDDATGNK